MSGKSLNGSFPELNYYYFKLAHRILLQNGNY